MPVAALILAAQRLHRDLARGRPGTGRTRSRAFFDGRPLIAWAAMFGLVLQLAAAALCLAGSPVDRQAGLAAPAICHGQSDRSGDDSGAPDHRAGACPFCSLHGHVGLAASPPAPFAIPVVIAAEPIEPPAFAARPLSRRPTDAAPRGPPSAG